MSRVRVFLIICFVMLCAAPSRAQSCSPTDPSNCLYVSTLAGEQIIAVDRTTGAKTVLVTEVGSRYEDLVVGPDLRLYACDPGNNRVKRFELNGVNGEVVYQGLSSPPLRPQCGRFSHTGDLYLNTKAPDHSGVWKISGVAQIGLGGAFPAPVNVATAAQTASTDGEGLAVAPNGDLLAAADNKILKSVRPTFGSLTTTLISNLTDPIGLARDSTGNIYFTVDGGSLQKCDPAGSNCSTVATFSPGRAYLLEFDSSDNLYIATARSIDPIGPENGRIYRIPVGGTPVLLATLDKSNNKYPPALGVAIPATTRAIAKQFSGLKTYNYGSHTFSVTAGNCSLQVNARQASPAETNAALAANSIPGGSESYLGEGGFALAYEVEQITPPGCSPGPDGDYLFAINAFLDNFSNPRVVRCPGTPLNPLGAMSCVVADTQGVYPISQIQGIPGDPQIIVRTGGTSVYFVANVSLGAGNNPLAEFCGWQSPLDPNATVANAPAFKSGQTISAKFKLVALNQSCSNGTPVNSALALIAVARIKNAAGADVFEAVTVVPAGQSSGVPLFSFNPNNKQYSFSLSLEGYLPGTYSISALFLTNNAALQTTFIKVR